MSLDLESFKILYNYDTHQLIIKQYLDLQYKYQDNIIFFRIGEFYEIFFDQAKVVAEVASINLTTKFGVKMCGIPYASINLYAGKLVDAGYSIAVAEQVNDNGNSDANSKNNNKKILSRSVVKIITPGTFIDREIASSSLSQYLLSFSVENNVACIVYIDLHTGEFIIEDTESAILYSRIKSIEPKEILLEESQEYNTNIHSICLVSRLKINDSIKLSYEKLLEIFHLSSDESIKNIKCNIRKRCITNILHYIYNINKEVDIRKPVIYGLGSSMVIDFNTQVALELINTKNSKKAGSFIWSIDKTVTPGGARLLKTLIQKPFNNIADIEKRQNLTQFFYDRPDLSNNIAKILSNYGDIARIISKISRKYAAKEDLLVLKNSLTVCMDIKDRIFETLGSSITQNLIGDFIFTGFECNSEIFTLLEDAVNEDIYSQELIKNSYCPRLDDLRNLLNSCKQKIETLKDEYKKLTGIRVQINENNILGLFVEAPIKFIKNFDTSIFQYKQSTSTVVRFKTELLDILEKELARHSILINSLEQEIFFKICDEVKFCKESISALDSHVSLIDVYSSFGRIAHSNNFSMPILSSNNNSIEIISGSHVIAEKCLQAQGVDFTKNNLSLSKEVNTIILTGPNMGGKSTYLKQAALIAIMAQMGSFVPATYCKMDLIDRIFYHAEIGDDIRGGKSSFMVEMEYIANIAKFATNKSLILLDEACRGTSAEDGIAICRALIEYLSYELGSRNLIATHFREIARAYEKSNSIKNLKMTVIRSGNNMNFSNLISVGIEESAMGISIARISGLMDSILNRAQELLET